MPTHSVGLRLYSQPNQGEKILLSLGKDVDAVETDS